MSESSLITRRTFLATGAALAAGAAVPSAILADTTAQVEVTEHRLLLPGLPTGLEGFRIAHITDVHLYEGYHPAAEQALAALERIRPDLIVVTGDMWDTPAGNVAAGEWLQSLPCGVPAVAVLGNHDYSHLPRGVRPDDAYRRAGVPLLVNDVLVLESGGSKLAIAGLDDLRRGSPDPRATARQIPHGASECWLIHEPGMLDGITWPNTPAPRFALLGHTHGGQVRVPGIPAARPRGSGRYLAGSYDVRGVPAYVSRGIGTSGVRLRVGCPAELPVFTLSSGA